MKFSAIAVASFVAVASAKLQTLPSDWTVSQASAQCGDKAQLSCCNEAHYSGDYTKANSGVAAGLLSDVAGGSGSAEGIGAFNGCSKLDVSVLIGVQDLLNQVCKQNVACCQQSPGQANNDLVGATLPCIGIGSVL